MIWITFQTNKISFSYQSSTERYTVLLKAFNFSKIFKTILDTLSRVSTTSNSLHFVQYFKFSSQYSHARRWHLILIISTCSSNTLTEQQRGKNGVTIYDECLYGVTIRICITSVTQNSSTPEPSFPSYSSWCLGFLLFLISSPPTFPKETYYSVMGSIRFMVNGQFICVNWQKSDKTSCGGFTLKSYKLVVLE